MCNFIGFPPPYSRTQRTKIRTKIKQTISPITFLRTASHLYPPLGFPSWTWVLHSLCIVSFWTSGHFKSLPNICIWLFSKIQSTLSCSWRSNTTVQEKKVHRTQRRVSQPEVSSSETVCYRCRNSVNCAKSNLHNHGS